MGSLRSITLRFLLAKHPSWPLLNILHDGLFREPLEPICIHDLGRHLPSGDPSNQLRQLAVQEVDERRPRRERPHCGKASPICSFDLLSSLPLDRSGAEVQVSDELLIRRRHAKHLADYANVLECTVLNDWNRPPYQRVQPGANTDPHFLSDWEPVPL